MTKKIMAVFGTRPEAIKMAPVIKALKETEGLETLVCVTAQHRQMLDQVLDLFSLVPDYDLDIMKERQDLFDITARALEGLKGVFCQEKPDLVLVQGDTSTTFAAALAAFYLKIPVGHVEAGLRTQNKYSPFPEEINRRLTTHLADLHFAPTDWAKNNLLAEGVAEENIWVTGNTVIDALLSTVRPDYRFHNELASLDFKRPLLLVTTHRRENWGEKMRGIFEAFLAILEEFPEAFLVFPVHKNPVVRDLAREVLGRHERVLLTEPLEYMDLANLMARCRLVLTDSGGLQEEAPSLGKPVLVLRDTTERPEAVLAGTARLVGTDPANIKEAAARLLSDPEEYDKMARAVNPYGDGRAAGRIRDVIKDFLT